LDQNGIIKLEKGLDIKKRIKVKVIVLPEEEISKEKRKAPTHLTTYQYKEKMKDFNREDAYESRI
jgi:hypothetical protein